MRKITVLPLLILLLSPCVFADQLSTFNNKLDNFLDDVNLALPDSAVVGGTWSDAYIGQLIGMPPHFGIGVAAGASRFDISSLNDAVKMTGSDLPTNTLVLPNFAVEARIGGFVKPFDIGFRFGMIPKTTISDVTINYINFGADIRYALLKDGLAKPDLIVGFGYYHTGGDISYTFDKGKLASIGLPYNSGKEDMSLSFSTNVFEVKTQVSKTLFAITPYAGIGVYAAANKSSYDITTQNGSSSNTTFGTRVFGGFSLNVFALKLDFSGMYNFITKNWGANLGTRIQI